MASQDRKPRFVLVDPSFDGKSGDKWQYAVSFAASARDNGYEFHLASALGSPSIAELSDDIIEHRIFSFGFYQHDKIVRRHDQGPVHTAERARAMRVTRKLNRLEEDVRRAWDANDRGAVELAERRLRQARREAARLSQDAEDRLTAEKVTPFNRDDYAKALAELIRTLDLGKGDRLFFHTVTPAMMESLSEVRIELGLSRLVDVDAHFLFHFGAEATDSSTFLDRYHSYSDMRGVGQRMKAGSPFARNYFLATSTVLAEECEEIFGVPCGLFEGLSNLSHVVEVLGGADATQAIYEKRQGQALKGRPFKVLARAIDLNEAACQGLLAMHDFLTAQGVSVDLRVVYHQNALSPLRDIAAVLGNKATFVDTDDNDDYIRAVADADVAVLTYIAERYAKRVSAVLHDCSVLGVPCLVPAGTTMEQTRDYADITVFNDVSELPGLAYSLWKRRTDPVHRATRDALMAEARRRFATNVIQRVIDGQRTPSVEAVADPEVAVVVMPAWLRCGSSVIMDSQVRFLIERGYFVCQVMLFDKAVDDKASMSYLWHVLRDNSANARGHGQRVLYSSAQEVEALEDSEAFLSLSPFHQHLQRIAAGSLNEPAFETLCKASKVTVVNHVFHSAWAKRYCSGVMILEAHDIQSYQMVKWPLIDIATDRPAPLGGLLRDELAEVATFEHVVNVSAEEDKVFKQVAKATSLVVPYTPRQLPDPTMTTIHSMVASEGLSEWYHGIEKFELLLLGDSHQSNMESAKWFIDEVYKPHLMNAGMNLVIVGKLSSHLFDAYKGTGGVYFAGFIKDLATFRANCLVSLLPDRRGTGISIKTLETFQEGGAFVATPLALRGMESEQVDAIQTFDDPAAYAAEIKRLVKSADARKKLGQAALKAYESVGGQALYDARWARIVDGLLGTHD